MAPAASVVSCPVTWLVFGAAALLGHVAINEWGSLFVCVAHMLTNSLVAMTTVSTVTTSLLPGGLFALSDL